MNTHFPVLPGVAILGAGAASVAASGVFWAGERNPRIGR
jgi:hypothetical protein